MKAIADDSGYFMRFLFGHCAGRLPSTAIFISNRTGVRSKVSPGDPEVG